MKLECDFRFKLRAKAPQIPLKKSLPLLLTAVATLLVGRIKSPQVDLNFIYSPQTNYVMDTSATDLASGVVVKAETFNETAVISGTVAIQAIESNNQWLNGQVLTRAALMASLPGYGTY